MQTILSFMARDYTDIYGTFKSKIINPKIAIQWKSVIDDNLKPINNRKF